MNAPLALTVTRQIMATLAAVSNAGSLLTTHHATLTDSRGLAATQLLLAVETAMAELARDCQRELTPPVDQAGTPWLAPSVN